MNHQIENLKSSQSGFSFIEMIIGLAVSISLILIMIYSYMTIRRIYQLNVNIISMQNAAYAAEQILSRDIRTAGFAGCLRLDSAQTLHQPVNIQFDMDNRVRGYASDQLPKEMRFIAKEVKQGSDVIVIEKMANDPVLLKAINKRKKYHVHELLMISDCANRVIFQYTQNNLIAALNNKNEFSAIAQIAPLEKIVFYIATTGRTTSNRAPIYALYRKNLWGEDSEQTEIVDGIENMQIRYGIKSPYNEQINYYTALQIHNWSQVSVIKINLLLSSKGPVNFIHQPVQYGDDKLNATDDRLLREWFFTIAIRES